MGPSTRIKPKIRNIDQTHIATLFTLMNEKMYK